MYALAIIIPLALGGIVGFITSGSMDYDMLRQPALSPPAILFPIVWTILYILMGVSFGLLMDKGVLDDNVKWIYYIQLFVNLVWPILFFTLKWRLLAFIWIIVLDFLVLTMVVKFYGKDKIAGLLQIPYLAWVLFATYLNLGVYLLNR
ncbi:MAG: tryptophan-rich sensory protein [Ruminococcus sp.]|nr:tryptophan-rich sensory protein [Ruminococcus sp.]